MQVPSTPAVRSDFGLIGDVGHAWNSIPVGIRQSCTIGSFKKRLKNFLIKKNNKLNYNIDQLFILFSYQDLIYLINYLDWGGVSVGSSMHIFLYIFFLSRWCGDQLYSGGDW